VTVRLTPTPVPKEQNAAWLASLPEPNALSYVFRFPFDIYYRPDIRKVSVASGGHTWTLHPPFADSRDKGPDKFDIDAASPSTPGPEDDPRVWAKMNLQMGGAEAADAIRLDVQPPLDVGLVEPIADLILAQLRARTLQWWLERDRRNTDGYLKHRVALDATGVRSGPVEAFLTYTEPFGFERPVDEAVLEGALTEAVEGRRPPVYFSLLLDGVYHFSVDHRERAILDLATCCEAALDHYLRPLAPARVSRSKVKKALRLDFDDRLDIGLREVLGVSYGDVSAEDTAELRALWVARGMVAHAKPPMTRRGAGRSPTTSEDVHRWVVVVARFREWLHKTAV